MGERAARRRTAQKVYARTFFVKIRWLNPAIVRAVIEHRLGDFEALGRELLAT